MPNLAHKLMKNNILTLAIALIFALSVTASAQRNNFAAAGQTASLQTLSGETVSLDSAKGKVVVLAIGASWLPLSKQQVITTNKLVKKYGNSVVIYWVTTESSNAKSKNYASNEAIQAFATKNKLTAPILRDSDGAATLKKYAVDQLPSFVVLDKTGKSIGEPFGGLDPQNEPEFFIQVSTAIDKVL
jgi:thiol-disulfide isomerase/thioredoxin